MSGKPKYTIGRDRTCDIPIADDSVSRLHAEISFSERGQIVLTDLRSQNGTLILRGGKSIEVHTEILTPTDEIRFGDVTLSAKDVIQSIERNAPGAFSAPSGQAMNPALAPPPPPPSIGFGARPPAAAPLSPPGATPQPSPGRLIRCECGAVKTIGVPCPGCHR
ncbi:MAG: FHA domain-containing protein [Bryobacteraceae bacterium]